MKKILLLFLLALSFSSCHVCLSKPSGRYDQHFNNVENYIDFKDDGTYYHFYKSDMGELKNTGEWKMSDDNNCIVELYDFKTFNEEGKYKDFGSYALWVDDHYLNDGPDGETSLSFEKVDKQ